jgi:nucleoside-diphosphate-sugar epimerase
VEYADSTPGDQFGIYADVNLAGKNLGWKPAYSLDKGLKSMVSWIKER